MEKEQIQTEEFRLLGDLEEATVPILVPTTGTVDYLVFSSSIPLSKSIREGLSNTFLLSSKLETERSQQRNKPIHEMVNRLKATNNFVKFSIQLREINKNKKKFVLVGLEQDKEAEAGIAIEAFDGGLVVGPRIALRNLFDRLDFIQSKWLLSPIYGTRYREISLQVPNFSSDLFFAACRVFADDKYIIDSQDIDSRERRVGVTLLNSTGSLSASFLKSNSSLRGDTSGAVIDSFEGVELDLSKKNTKQMDTNLHFQEEIGIGILGDLENSDLSQNKSHFKASYIFSSTYKIPKYKYISSQVFSLIASLPLFVNHTYTGLLGSDFGSYILAFGKNMPCLSRRENIRLSFLSNHEIRESDNGINPYIMFKANAGISTLLPSPLLTSRAEIHAGLQMRLENMMNLKIGTYVGGELDRPGDVATGVTFTFESI